MLYQDNNKIEVCSDTEINLQRTKAASELPLIPRVELGQSRHSLVCRYTEF